jgi:hypothetical protein
LRGALSLSKGDEAILTSRKPPAARRNCEIELVHGI